MEKKLVLIKWLDSKSGSPVWEYVEEIELLQPVTCESVGFLIDDNKAFKTLVSTLGGSQVLGRITIPSCSIINYQVLSR